IDRQTGRFAPLLPPEQAERDYTPPERAYREALRADSFVGTGEQVAARLTALADDLGIDEMVVLTWTYDAAAQRRSYEVLAKALGMVPGTAQSGIAQRTESLMPT
ncbi:MAG: hypothetical protein RIQ96_1221, partial [Pseudomonadota bacterium]